MKTNCIFTFMLLCACSTTAWAFEGTLIVNGFEIPSRWSASYDRQRNIHNDHPNCKIDDTFLAEQMVSMVLGMQEAKKRGLSLSESQLAELEDIKTKYEDFPDDTDPSYNAKSEALFLESRRTRYSQLFVDRASDEQVLAEYERWVSIGHPEVVNRQLIRMFSISWTNDGTVEELADLASRGLDYTPRAIELIGQRDFDYAVDESKEWVGYTRPKAMHEGETELQVGDTDVGTLPAFTKFYEVMDSKMIPLIGIDDDIRGISTPRDRIKRVLFVQAYIDWYKEVRAKAKVTLNGETLPEPEYDTVLFIDVQRDKIHPTYCSGIIG